MRKILFLVFILFFHINILLAQTPGGISAGTTQLKFWVKANTKTVGKLTLNGSTVSSWADENSTYAVSQAVTTKQPTFVNNLNPIGDFNFNSYLHMNATNSTTLTNALTISGLNSNNMTAFVVSNSRTGSGTSFAYASGTNKIQFKDAWRVQNGISGLGYVCNTIVPPGSLFNNPNFGDSAARIITMHGMGANFNARVNAKIFPITYSGSSTYNPAVASGVSVASSGTAAYANDDFAEIIMYNTKLSLADVNKVESYLGIKYGITNINKQNYTLANNYVLWDSIIDSSYYHNLTAIAREDSSGLY